MRRKYLHQLRVDNEDSDEPLDDAELQEIANEMELSYAEDLAEDRELDQQMDCEAGYYG